MATIPRPALLRSPLAPTFAARTVRAPLSAHPLARFSSSRAMASTNPAVELWVKGDPKTDTLLDCE